jgi:hypothetical protein
LLSGPAVSIPSIFDALSYAYKGHRVKRFFVQTYIFWMFFSFYNLSFFIGLTIPPLLLVLSGYYAKFIPSIWLPLVFSLATVLIAFLVIRNTIWIKSNAMLDKFYPFVFNGIFLIVFLLSTDFYKNHLIISEAKKYNVNYVYVRSFIGSLGIIWVDFQFSSHAGFQKEGKLYLWSYREREFYICPENVKSNVGLPSTKLLVP